MAERGVNDQKKSVLQYKHGDANSGKLLAFDIIFGNK